MSRVRLVTVATVSLAVIQPPVRAALFANVAHILEMRAIERPARLLKLNANRMTDVVVSRHLEREIFTAPETQSLAEALWFAQLSEDARPDSRAAFFLARLNAMLGDEPRALEALERSSPADAPAQWTVLRAVLNERLGAHDPGDDWSIDGDASASYFVDLSLYLSERRDVQGAGESLRRALRYARSPGAIYVANYRMALHKMYGWSQPEASLPYFRSAERQLMFVSVRPADEFGLRLSYGHALINAGHFADAVAQVSRAAALDPQSPHAHELLGRAYLDMGSPSVARVAYAKSLRLYAESRSNVPGYTYWGFGQTELAVGDRVRAKELLELAVHAGVDPDLRAHIVSVLADLHKSQ